MGQYETLGVNKNATTEEIKRAYRDKAKENHPDKGGDKGIFQSVALAYGILSNPDKRQHYDQTGETSTRNLHSEFMTYLNNCISGIMQGGVNVASVDIVDILIKNTQANVQNQEHELKNKQQVLAKVISIRKRAKYKKTDNDLLKLVLDGNEVDLNREISLFKERIKRLNEYLEILANYEYDFEELPSPMQFYNMPR